jgi:hypothetical protein
MLLGPWGSSNVGRELVPHDLKVHSAVAGAVLFSDEIFIKVDVEALLETELQRALQKRGAAS